VNEKEGKDLGYIICGPEAEEGGRKCVHLSSEGTEVGRLLPFDGFANAEDGCRIVEGKVRGPLMKVTDISNPISKKPSSAAVPTKGPAKVASDEYRNGWDVIWGKPEVGQA
jgi:hypothetical protein